jgi:antitoxin-like ribbon-helix-helix protein
MPAKRVHLDTGVLEAIQLLGADEGKSFQDLADEAFADLLKKHHRPVGLRNALRQSLRGRPANTNARNS